MQNIVISSGYFDPIHKGHIDYLKSAKKLFSDSKHIAIVNNEIQVFLKKGFMFLPVKDRMDIVRELKCVDEVFESLDMDESVCLSLETLAKRYSGNNLYFVKGGDKKPGNILEEGVCEEYNITIKYGLGEKIQSSSKIIKDTIERIIQSRRAR